MEAEKAEAASQKAQRILIQQAKIDAEAAAKETKRKEFEDKKKNKIQEGINLAVAINKANTERYPGEDKLLVTLRIMSCESAAEILQYLKVF